MKNIHMFACKKVVLPHPGAVVAADVALAVDYWKERRTRQQAAAPLCFHTGVNIIASSREGEGTDDPSGNVRLVVRVCRVRTAYGAGCGCLESVV